MIEKHIQYRQDPSGAASYVCEYIARNKDGILGRIILRYDEFSTIGSKRYQLDDDGKLRLARHATDTSYTSMKWSASPGVWSESFDKSPIRCTTLDAAIFRDALNHAIRRAIVLESKGLSRVPKRTLLRRQGFTDGQIKSLFFPSKLIGKRAYIKKVKPLKWGLIVSESDGLYGISGGNIGEAVEYYKRSAFTLDPEKRTYKR